MDPPPGSMDLPTDNATASAEAPAVCRGCARRLAIANERPFLPTGAAEALLPVDLGRPRRHRVQMPRTLSISSQMCRSVPGTITTTEKPDTKRTIRPTSMKRRICLPYGKSTPQARDKSIGRRKRISDRYRSVSTADGETAGCAGARLLRAPGAHSVT